MWPRRAGVCRRTVAQWRTRNHEDAGCHCDCRDRRSDLDFAGRRPEGFTLRWCEPPGLPHRGWAAGRRHVHRLVTEGTDRGAKVVWSTVQQRTPPTRRVAVQDRALSDVERRVTPAEQARRPWPALRTRGHQRWGGRRDERGAGGRRRADHGADPGEHQAPEKAPVTSRRPSPTSRRSCTVRWRPISPTCIRATTSTTCRLSPTVASS